MGSFLTVDWLGARGLVVELVRRAEIDFWCIVLKSKSVYCIIDIV